MVVTEEREPNIAGTGENTNNNGAKETESAKTKGRHVRKMGRRRTKFINLVQKDIGLNVTQTPSEWLIVWGYGFANGTTKKEIQSQFGNPNEIRYFKDKAYCFMKYNSVEEANIVKEMHEEVFLELSLREENPVKRFIGFVNDEPPPEDLQLIESFTANKIPLGLRIINDFVSKEEEELILSRIGPDHERNDSPNIPVETITKILKHRWVRHFGYEFRYGSNDIDFDNPLSDPVPEYLAPVIDRMGIEGVFVNQPPEQVTVNRYQSGQGIPPHVDTHSCFEGPIVSLSLGSEIVMNFRRGEELFSAILPPRSLLVMDGDARHGWTHGIANRTFDIIPTSSGIDVLHRSIRLSLTFRKLRQSRVCSCSFPEMCDSQKGKISKENAANLEEKMVHKVYERIAPHFHETRHTPWPKVKSFIQSIQDGAVILDIGCGNGKYFHMNDKTIQIGTDMSSGLLDICKKKNCEVLRANALQLPFKDDSVQAVICIAVLHHVSTKERRMAAISEMMRVLTVGGQALIYVWSKDQHHKDEESVYAAKQQQSTNKSLVDPCVAKSSDFSFIPVHDRQADFTQNDVLVPWVNVKDEVTPVHHRYYHVFDQGELESLISELKPTPKLLDSYYDQGNWVVKIIKET